MDRQEAMVLHEVDIRRCREVATDREEDIEAAHPLLAGMGEAEVDMGRHHLECEGHHLNEDPSLHRAIGMIYTTVLGQALLWVPWRREPVRWRCDHLPRSGGLHLIRILQARNYPSGKLLKWTSGLEVCPALRRRITGCEIVMRMYMGW